MLYRKGIRTSSTPGEVEAEVGVREHKEELYKKPWLITNRSM